MKTLLEELDVDVPIARYHPVASFMHVVVEAVSEDGLFRHWPNIGAEVVLAEELIDGSGSYLCEELAFWIRPVVCAACLQQEGPRRNERDEHVCVHRCFVGESAPLRIVRCELIGIARGSGKVRDRLAVFAMAQRRAALARTTSDDRREALIVCAGPHHGLAQS